MKKTIAICLLLTLLLGLAACGGQTPEDTAPNTTGAATEPSQPAATDLEPGYVFEVNGLQIPMGVEAAPILAALGEPKSYTETTSCAFTGLDKTYFYGDFYLFTCPMHGGEYVYGLMLATDSVQTAEGLYIGATQAQVESLYGREGFNGENGYVLTKGASKLTVILKDGLVSDILYDAVF